MSYIITISIKDKEKILKEMSRPTDIFSIINYVTDSIYKDISNCILAYSQCGEMILLLKDNESIQDIYGNICSLVTKTFYSEGLYRARQLLSAEDGCYISLMTRTLVHQGYQLSKAVNNILFDIKYIKVSNEEIIDYLIYRQSGLSYDSLLLFAQDYYSKSEIIGMSKSFLIEKLLIEKGIKWGNQRFRDKFGLIYINRLDKNNPEWDLYDYEYSFPNIDIPFDKQTFKDMLNSILSC